MIIDMQLGSIYLAVCLTVSWVQPPSTQAVNTPGSVWVHQAAIKAVRVSRFQGTRNGRERQEERDAEERKVTGGQRQALEYA